MNYTVKFDVPSEMEHTFNEGKYEVRDLYESIPLPVIAYIEDEKCQQIGEIKGYFLYNTPDFLYKCDNESGDIAVIAEGICDENEMVDMLEEDAGVFILDNLLIFESHSGLGIGSSIMKNLPHMVNNQFNLVNAIFLCASDFTNDSGFDSQEYKEGTDRLIKFYEKCGYEVIKDSVMFKLF